MPIFSRAGVRLHYEASGSGEPVVLLHGFASLGSTWQRSGWIDLVIGNGFRAITLDFRSHGQSDLVFDPALCSTEVLAADVVGLLDHLGIERASLVGFSMGGGVALRIALDAPERVRALVVGGVGDDALAGRHDPADIEALLAAFSATSVKRGRTGAALRRNAELAGNDLHALMPYLRQGGWPGTVRDLVPVQAPVLLIVADADEYMGRTSELRERLDPDEILELEDLGHHGAMRDERVRTAAIQFLTP